ncbi:PorV/PorQ family protein, partial [candidate division KSB1 bacterium]|nr:PorV/PorQ family protein [candidate division KSB1 bacterium]
MQKKHILLSGMFFLSTSMVLGQSIITDVSKSGTSAATFLEIPIGAPAVGMGSAFVSLASDATALYWNVAGTAELEHNEVVALHSSWLAGTSLDFVGLVFSLGNFGNVGISLTSLSMDDMVVRTVEQPAGTGEFFNASDIAAGLSYSRKLTDRFSIGVTAKYIRQEIWHESASAFAIDVGT